MRPTATRAGRVKRSAALLRLPRALGLFGLLLGSAGALSCEARSRAAGPAVVAEFGIFYGGQIQERQEIPAEVDRTRQLQGFRLRLDPPPTQPLEVRWELGMPGVGPLVSDSQGRRARARKVQLGRVGWRPGETVLEQALPFLPGDPLGLWNIRVLVGSDVVMDRPFLVYDARSRERHRRALAERDGGL